jgi:TM2 domain-containing membrane protein YozV
MYKIIGGDGKEYGPVTAEQIRTWLREGRSTLQTLVQPEGTADWKPLSSLPEFGVPPSVMPPVAGATTIPGADKKIAAGLCGIFLGHLGIHKFILGYTNEAVTMLVISLCSIPLGVLTCGIGLLGIAAIHIIGLIEGIIYLSKSDAEFVATYIRGRKGWF